MGVLPTHPATTGGHKQSGFGVENGTEGLSEFTNTKTLMFHKYRRAAAARHSTAPACRMLCPRCQDVKPPRCSHSTDSLCALLPNAAPGHAAVDCKEKA